jgi:hypothetical protein
MILYMPINIIGQTKQSWLFGWSPIVIHPAKGILTKEAIARKRRLRDLDNNVPSAAYALIHN